MSAKTLKSEVVAAAVATSGCGPEGVEVVEGAEVEQAFGRLEHLYAQLPAMEEKGAALARARSAATVDGLAKAAAYRAAELVRADALVTEAEARVSAAEAEGEQAAGEARLALMVLPPMYFPPFTPMIHNRSRQPAPAGYANVFPPLSAPPSNLSRNARASRARALSEPG